MYSWDFASQLRLLVSCGFLQYSPSVQQREVSVVKGNPTFLYDLYHQFQVLQMFTESFCPVVKSLRDCTGFQTDNVSFSLNDFLHKMKICYPWKVRRHLRWLGTRHIHSLQLGKFIRYRHYRLSECDASVWCSTGIAM